MHEGGAGEGVEEGCSFWCQHTIRSPGLQCQRYPILYNDDTSGGCQRSVYSSHTLPHSHLIPGDLHHHRGILCSNTPAQLKLTADSCLQNSVKSQSVTKYWTYHSRVASGTTTTPVHILTCPSTHSC